jgi:hypothetical protein
VNVKYVLGDREYEFDGEIKVEEAMALYDKTNCGLNEMDAALNRGNPYAIAAWMFMLKRRAGDAVRWQDMLKLDVRTFNVIVPEAADKEEGEGDAVQLPDPTQPDGTTPESATTGT